MQLDTESLRTFIAVVDSGGFTSAARQLGFSQSAVSWKIKRLEEKVGRPLLLRDGHTLDPSRDGRELLGHARTIVAAHDLAVSRLTSSDLRGSIRFGANEEVTSAHLVEAASRFNHRHPDVDIEYTVDYSTELEEMIDEHRLDIAIFQIREHDLRPTDVVLWENELLWLTGPGTSFSPTERIPLVTFGEQGFYRPVAEAALQQAGLDYTVTLSAASTQSVFKAVAGGFGIAVLTDEALEFGLEPWEPGPALSILPRVAQIARKAPGESGPIVDALIDALREDVDVPWDPT
jgi:DNA-binding transcriptional LysR family regulator